MGSLPSRHLRNLCAGARFCNGDSRADGFSLVNPSSVRQWVLLFAFFASARPFFGVKKHYVLGGQPVAVLVEVDQREGHAQPPGIFPDTAVTDLGKSEDMLRDAKSMLDSASYAGFGRVLKLGFFINLFLVLGPARSHILRHRRGCANRVGPALIAGSPRTLRIPCSKSGNLCSSATLAAVVATEYTTASLRSTPMRALAPKSH